MGPPPVPTTSTTTTAPRTYGRNTIRSAFDQKKSRLTEQFHTLYDKGEAFKEDVVAARNDADHARAGRAFASTLVSAIKTVILCLLIL